MACSIIVYLFAVVVLSVVLIGRALYSICFAIHFSWLKPTRKNVRIYRAPPISSCIAELWSFKSCVDRVFGLQPSLRFLFLHRSSLVFMLLVRMIEPYCALSLPCTISLRAWHIAGFSWLASLITYPRAAFLLWWIFGLCSSSLFRYLDWLLYYS
jgi:hypothetical protein